MARAFAEALARGADRGGGFSILPTNQRLKDLRSMNSQPRILLTTLSERTSAKGNKYLAGLLKASVVAFPGKPDEHGNPRWDVFLQEPRARCS